MAIGPITAGCDYVAVTGTSGLFSQTLLAGQQYLVVANAAVWVKVTTAAGAAAADTDGNVLVPSNTYFPIALDPDVTANNRLAIIHDGANCDACLIRIGG